MSEQEILEEQEKLVLSLDPSLLQFLRNRRPGVEPVPGETAKLNLSGDTSMEQIISQSVPQPSSKPEHRFKPEHEPELHPEPEPDLMNKYPNMNRDEPEKRQWMSNIPEVMFSSSFYFKESFHTFRADQRELLHIKSEL